MSCPRAGWSVALSGVGLSASAWLPWLTTSADGGGRASGIGGTLGSIVLPARFGAGQLIVLLASVLVVLGAMVARGVSPRLAAAAAVTISVLIGALTWWYHRTNVEGPVSGGYGLYLAAGGVLAALGCSIWALAAATVGAGRWRVPRR